jgi:hypothetical protein
MSLLGGGLTGDIWSTGAFSFESPLKDLLDSGNFTLEQLLAEDELLQEMRGVHPKLMAYFQTEAAVTKLVQYLILPPDEIDTGTVRGKANASGNGSDSVVAAAVQQQQLSINKQVITKAAACTANSVAATTW